MYENINKYNDKLLSYNDKLLKFDGQSLIFKIDGSTSFNPTLFASSIGRWDFGDGTFYEGNAPPVKIYPDTNEYIIKYRNRNLNDVTNISFERDSLKGTIDLSKLTNLSGNVNLRINPNITKVINPKSSKVIDVYNIYDANIVDLDLSTFSKLAGLNARGCPSLVTIINPSSTQEFIYYLAHNCPNLTGILDISGLTGLGKRFEVDDCNSLTGIINPISSELFTKYAANNCNLGTLDVSTLTGLGGEFLVHFNPNLTTIINPISSQVFTRYYVYNCNLTDTLDVSGLSGLGRNFQVQNNLNLTNIIHPNSTQLFDYYIARGCNLDYIDLKPLVNLTENNDVLIELQSNNMSATDVNHILVDLDSMSTSAFTGRIISIGGTNGTVSADTYDGLTAIANLIAKGFTVTTS